MGPVSRIRAARDIFLAEDELEFHYIRASGPGGQNVNKVSSAVQLRFDVMSSPSLPEDVRSRLIGLAGAQITDNGILVIEAKRFRTQEKNRQDAVARLIQMIGRAAERPKIRKKTRPTEGSILRRLEEKRRRGEIKRSRKGDFD